MDTNEYQQLALSTEADQEKILNRLYRMGSSIMRLDNGGRGLADDAGEVNGVIKRCIEYGEPLDTVQLLEECGDCLWRICQILAAAGFTLEECMQANLDKLKIRYDGGYSDTKAAEANRDRKAERKVLEGTHQIEKDGPPPDDWEGSLSHGEDATEWIKKAMGLGCFWQGEPTCPGIPFLAVPVDHPARKWATRWVPMSHVGPSGEKLSVMVPHWLPRWVRERSTQLRPLDDPKLGERFLEQTGQGWAEPADDLAHSVSLEPPEDMPQLKANAIGSRLEKLTGFDIARQVTDAYVQGSDRERALKYINEQEAKSNAL